MNKHIPSALIAALAMVISGCGGGSGGGSSDVTATDQSPPTAINQTPANDPGQQPSSGESETIDTPDSPEPSNPVNTPQTDPATPNPDQPIEDTQNSEPANEDTQNSEPVNEDTQDSEPANEDTQDSEPANEDTQDSESDEPALDPVAEQTTYLVTVRNFWGVEDFPQDFPDQAHLSLWGGATHNEAVSFWSVGEPPSRGIEDMAEAGLIDILLFDEVAPAIEQGSAGSFIEIRLFTEPAIDGEPGLLEFEVTVTRTHPLVSMVSMLGPSPDWFVGVDSLSLLGASDDSSGAPAEWIPTLTVGSPLYDGGSKSDIIPIMGGPDIIPPDPIGLVAYDAATGVYLPSDTPQIVTELQFTRIR